MTIYVIKPDLANFKAIYTVEDDDNMALEIEGYFDFKGQPRDDWNGARLYITEAFESDKDKLSTPDIIHFRPSILAYSKKAVEVLKDILEESGELLPCECDGQKWWIHNITNVVDIIDYEASKMEMTDSGKFNVAEVIYDKEKLSEICLFKQIKRLGFLFGHDKATNDYKSRVEKFGLTGLTFSN